MHCLKLLANGCTRYSRFLETKNNPLYYDIDINLDKIPRQWVDTIIESNDDENISKFNAPNENINREHTTFIDDNQPLKTRDFNIDNEISVERDDIEEDSDPLDDYQMRSSETAYVADVQFALRDDASTAITPGETKTPFVKF